MTYKIMRKLIELGTMPKEELRVRFYVHYAAGRLTKEEYEKLTKEIGDA